MIKVEMDGVHDFRKKNVVTLEDSNSQYDIMVCSKCNLTGKCRDLHTVEIDGRKKGVAERCYKSTDELKKEKATQDFEYAKPTDIKCPNCSNLLRSTADWIEEGRVGITHKSVICKCGFNDLLDVR